MNRFVAYLFGIITLGIGCLISLQQGMVGFPDGYRTAYDRASESLFSLFIYLSIGIGLYSFYIGYKQKSKNNLLFAILTYLITALIVLFISDHLYNTLDHGQGG